MNVEHKRLFWMSAAEVEEGLRDYIRGKGFDVPVGATVSGLWTGMYGVPECRNAVSVTVENQTSEVTDHEAV